jgi:hypothetical protein
MFNAIHKYFNPHRHSYKLIAINDEYTTTFTDSKRKISWSMRYYQCSCGKRITKVTNDYPYGDQKHSGVDAAVKNWDDCGVVPQKSYNPADNSYFVKPIPEEKEKIDPLVNLDKTVQDLCAMMNVIKRDYDLEGKYPKLKKAAENYRYLFDKYKTFEDLKAGKDEVNQ